MKKVQKKTAVYCTNNVNDYLKVWMLTTFCGNKYGNLEFHFCTTLLGNSTYFWASNSNWRRSCLWGRVSMGHICPKPCLPINKDVEQPEEEFPRCSGVMLPLKSNCEPQTAIFDPPCIQGMAKQLFPSFSLNVKGASPISPLDISKIIKLISLVGFPKWHVSGCPGASGLGNLTTSIRSK